MTRQPELEALLEFAVDLAWRAGRRTLAGFQTGPEIEWKADGTPVTDADRAAEALMRERIEARFPGHGIVGEEFGEVRARAKRRWILDPIDGTKAYARGVPLYGVLVALEERGVPVLGVMHFPALGEEVVYAARGVGCWWNGRRCSVSDVSALDAALVLTTDGRPIADPDRRAGWDRLRAGAGLARTWGDCYGHALVATGRAEVMVDPAASAWDAAALRPCVEEAGGVFSDWSGAATHVGGAAVSTNSAVSEVARRTLGVGR
ncbi:MAG TPA: histidinol-phosphatase [Longimicrobiales bacterium]|nr:histidinol-phosphatase [Longimicrobiales bacterium]